MNVDDYERTAKARQVRMEKHTVADVLQALEDLVGNELAPEAPSMGMKAPTARQEAPAPSDSWDEDIPVLRDIIVPPEVSSPRPGPPDARQMRDVVQRAVTTFNSRLQADRRLTATAVELLEHLLFEEWVRDTLPSHQETPDD